MPGGAFKFHEAILEGTLRVLVRVQVRVVSSGGAQLLRRRALFPDEVVPRRPVERHASRQQLSPSTLV